MDNFHSVAEFDQCMIDLANKVCNRPHHGIEMFNGTLYIAECTAAEAAKLQTLIGNLGVGVIVTPSATEYSFDFV